jgi:hypothetical protein
MLWNEPLGNPFDDIRFLQNTERHRGESVLKTRRELQIAGVLQTDKIGDEVREFFGGVCNAGFEITKDEEEIVKEDFEAMYKLFQDENFTLYGRKSIKHELKAYLFFLTIPTKYLSQFDADTTDFEIIEKGREVVKKKIKKLSDPNCFPFDNYLHFVYDSERTRASFKDNVPAEVVARAGFDAMAGVAKILEKIFTLNHKRTKNKVKGVNFDYLSLLMYFYIIEKNNGKGKILKSQKELASIWNIPLRTLKRKMSFLYKIDI